jgi:hypothetical protein
MVTEYRDRFLQLARYAPAEVANDGDNTCPPGFGNDNSKTIVFSTSWTCVRTYCSERRQTRPFDFQGLYTRITFQSY